MLGKPTTSRYLVATIYVDHYSDLTYVALKFLQNADETCTGKQRFEKYSATHGVHIQHYHADNGIFNSTMWRTSCTTERQGLSFSGVSVHHQNSIAERRIRVIEDMTHTSLNHARRKWRKAINYNLWPYTMKMAGEAINNKSSPKHQFEKTPLQMFTVTTITDNPKQWVHFGSPVYVLHSASPSNAPRL